MFMVFKIYWKCDYKRSELLLLFFCSSLVWFNTSASSKDATIASRIFSQNETYLLPLGKFNLVRSIKGKKNKHLEKIFFFKELSLMKIKGSMCVMRYKYLLDGIVKFIKWYQSQKKLYFSHRELAMKIRWLTEVEIHNRISFKHYYSMKKGYFQENSNKWNEYMMLIKSSDNQILKFRFQKYLFVTHLNKGIKIFRFIV